MREKKRKSPALRNGRPTAKWLKSQFKKVGFDCSPIAEANLDRTGFVHWQGPGNNEKARKAFDRVNEFDNVEAIDFTEYVEGSGMCGSFELIKRRGK